MESTDDLTEVMPKTRIGSADLEHSRLGLGCWAIAGSNATPNAPSQWGPQSPHDSRAALEVALRRDISHFDTSDAYHDGAGEAQLGHFLQQDYHRREHAFIATKGHAAEPTGDAIQACIHASMERLEVDCIDLFYVPWPFPSADMRPMFERLNELRGTGHVHGIGVSNFTIEQIEQIKDVCAIDACQVAYSLIWRQAEKELLPYCNENDIAVVTCASLGQGVLVDSFPHEPVFHRTDIRPTTVPFEPANWSQVVEAVKQLKGVAGEAGRPLSHLALRWLLNRDSVNSVLAGARNSIQVNELAGSVASEIDDSVFEKLTDISDELATKMPAVANLFRYYPQ